MRSQLVLGVPQLPQLRSRPLPMPSKVLLLVVDGIGDVTIPALGDRTPLQVAHTPFLDALAGTALDALVDSGCSHVPPLFATENMCKLILVCSVAECLSNRPIAACLSQPCTSASVTMPVACSFAAAGVNGLSDPVEPGLACGSDTAHMNLFGYDPRK